MSRTAWADFHDGELRSYGRKQSIVVKPHLLIFLVDVSTTVGGVIQPFLVCVPVFVRFLADVTKILQCLTHGGGRCVRTQQVLDSFWPAGDASITGAARQIGVALCFRGAVQKMGKCDEACASVILRVSASLTKRLKNSKIRMG